MKINKLQKEELTKKFVEGVEYLIKSGVVKKYKEIIDALEWDKTIFSSVINGRKDVPIYIYNKFNEVYFPERIEIQKNKSSIQIIEERGERLIALEAATTVLTAKIKELESIVTKRSSALVSLEVDKLMQDVLMQKLNELRKNNG